MTISDKKFVAVTYQLFVGEQDEKPKLMERASAGKPLQFIFGIGMMLEKFEENLKGLQVDDKFDFVIPPEDAYGENEEANIIDVDKSVFETDGEFDSDEIYVGCIVTAGNQLYGTVTGITEDKVQIDVNHPLAGETLHFMGRVLEVRDATDEDIAAFTQPGCSPDSCEGCKCGC